MKNKNQARAIQFFSLTNPMSTTGLMLTYVVYPLILMFEFLNFGAASPGNEATFNLMAAIFFTLTFAAGGILSFIPERAVGRQQKIMIFFALTITPSVALHSASLIHCFFNLKF